MHLSHSLHHNRQYLVSDARVRLLINSARLTDVAMTLQGLLAEELEAGFLLLPISVSRVEREGMQWRITLQLKEAFYG